MRSRAIDDFAMRGGWRLRLVILLNRRAARKVRRILRVWDDAAIIRVASLWNDPTMWPSGMAGRRELRRRWAPWGRRP